MVRSASSAAGWGARDDGSVSVPRFCLAGRPEKREYSRQFGCHLGNPGLLGPMFTNGRAFMQVRSNRILGGRGLYPSGCSAAYSSRQLTAVLLIALLTCIVGQIGATRCATA